MLPVVSYQQDDAIARKSESVAMRLIGHQLLKCIGDDSTRVSPVTIQENQYVISFEESLTINPTDLERIVTEVMEENDIADNYWVEVYTCDERELIHNFQVGPVLGHMIPCSGRSLPLGCYELVISLYEPKPTALEHTIDSAELSVFHWIGGAALSAILASLIWWFYIRPEEQVADPNIISIGSSVFDKKNMHLSYNDQKIELSHKEAELLYLLHTSANTPVERQVLLSQIWGDDGDYVGRTLDVFISRLRKKLQADRTVKIVNIRGVGYKLVMGD